MLYKLNMILTITPNKEIEHGSNRDELAELWTKESLALTLNPPLLEFD